MKMRFCVVPDCESSSANQPHLAYHKFPAFPETNRIWLSRMKLLATDLHHHTPQVCSKHFRKDDYLPHHKTCKRMLKKGAIPSIFSWGTFDPVPSAEELSEGNFKSSKEVNLGLASIKKLRAGAEIVLNDNGRPNKTESDSGGISLDDSFEDNDGLNKETETSKTDVFKDPELSFSRSMVESENSDHGSVTDTSSVSFTPEKSYGRSGKHGESNKYLPGVRLEAKDLSSNKWWKAKVVEVDWEDEEVLIHFEKWSNRYDEWIPMDSSRLRPIQSHSPSNQSAFRVGETVMASWSDNKMYAARIKSILSGDKYEVLFFDGFCKVVQGHKIAKGTEETLAMDPGLFHNAGPTTMTKAERREKKRKIGSVAELFQIKKRGSSDTEKTTSKRKSDNDRRKEDSCRVKVALSFDDKKREREGKTRHRSFPVIKGFAYEEKSRGSSEKKGKPKASSSSIHNQPIAGSSKEAPTTTPPTRAARRRKRDDNIDPSDYLNWEPEGEEAWLVESVEGLRRSIKVKDDRLPSGWAKHTIQRKSGNSAGKWDVFLVSPTGRRFRSRKEMHAYFADCGEQYMPELFDFTLRCNMRRKSADTEQIHFRKKPVRKDVKSPCPTTVTTTIAAVATAAATTPTESEVPATETVPPPTRRVKILLPKSHDERGLTTSPPPPHPTCQGTKEKTEGLAEARATVGHLKIQTENDAFVCPKEGCSKHFRRENLLQMHIKHYHPEYSKFMGTTPNVADLAYARTVGEPLDDLVPKARPLSASFFEQVNRFEAQKKTKLLLQAQQTVKPATPTPPTVREAAPTEMDVLLLEAKGTKVLPPELEVPASKPEVEDVLDSKLVMVEDFKPLPTGSISPTIPKPTPTLPNDFLSMPVTGAGIKTLLPVVRSPVKPPPQEIKEEVSAVLVPDTKPSAAETTPTMMSETALPKAETTPLPRSKVVKKRRLSDMYIETLKKRRLGKLTKCYDDSALHSRASGPVPPRFNGQQSKYRYLKKKKITTSPPQTALQPLNIPETSMDTSEPDGSPASVAPPVVEEEIYEQLQKRDIINCTCGIMEEDGLMIQCDLCLCWQHVLCNDNMEEVPDKYVCSICLNPARERKSSHYLHDQYWLNDGTLPSLSFRTKDEATVGRRESLLKRSHDLTGELVGYKDVLHSMRVKLSIAEQTDHPKLYLWAEKPTSTPSSSEPTTDSVDIKQEMLPTKTDASDPAVKLEDLKTEKEPLGHEMTSRPVEAEGSDHIAQTPSGSEAGRQSVGNVGNAEVPVQIEEHTKANANPTAVQDHTYVHVAPEEEETTKQITSCTPAAQPEEGLKLDSHILEQALSSGSIPDTAFVPAPTVDLNTDLHATSGSELAPGLNTSALIEAGLNVTSPINSNLSSTMCTLDAATQNQLLQLPICRSELMRFANSMADNFKDTGIEPAVLHSEPSLPKAPQPEKPIDPLECRLNLLDQIDDFQEQLDARLSLIEEQVTALEAEDPEPPSEETVTFYPQTKHTVQMLNRDLVTMKKLAMTGTGYSVVKW